MAAEEFGEKTEPATPRKRQEARERGQVPKSTDLNIALLLLGAFLAILFWGDAMGRGIADFVRSSLGNLGSVELTTATTPGVFSAVIQTAVTIVGPFVLAIGLVAFLSNFTQVGPLWASDALAPDVERLSPVRGMKRIFSARGLVKTAMGVGKLAIITTVVYLVLLRYLRPGPGRSIFALFDDDIHSSFSRVKTATCELGISCAVAMLLLAIFDYGFQRWQHEKDLRMSRQELREEMKRYEGDPKLKERRRRMQRQIAFQRYLKEVPRADVIVTNPTEFAVALGYDATRDAAPRVLAKGEGLLAQRIREVAFLNDVPVLQRPPLARALYQQVEVGNEIPHQLYEAVAEVLAYVWRVSGKPNDRVA